LSGRPAPVHRRSRPRLTAGRDHENLERGTRHGRRRALERPSDTPRSASNRKGRARPVPVRLRRGAEKHLRHTAGRRGDRRGARRRRGRCRCRRSLRGRTRGARGCGRRSCALCRWKRVIPPAPRRLRGSRAAAATGPGDQHPEQQAGDCDHEELPGVPRTTFFDPELSLSRPGTAVSGGLVSRGRFATHPTRHRGIGRSRWRGDHA
jgi:hypothetical protein